MCTLLECAECKKRKLTKCRPAPYIHVFFLIHIITPIIKPKKTTALKTAPTIVMVVMVDWGRSRREGKR